MRPPNSAVTGHNWSAGRYSLAAVLVYWGNIAAKIVLPCIVFGASLCAQDKGRLERTQISRESPLKVGAIFPLTGNSASLGISVRNGITLGLEDLDADERESLSFFFEDDQLVPRQTVSAFGRLTSLHNVEVVISMSSGASNAIAPLAEKKGIPLIALASSQELSRNRRYVVNFFLNPDEVVRVFLAEARKRGYRKLARITTTEEGLLAIQSVFDAQNSHMLTIVPDEQYPGGMVDFREFIARTKVEPAIDAVLVNLMPGQLGVFTKQARQLGLTLPFCGFHLFENAGEVEVSQGAMIGAWYVSPQAPRPEFMKRYHERFPAASNWGAAYGYDLTHLLAAAARHSQSPEEVNNYLHSVRNFSGVMGIYSASGDNRFTIPATVKVVTGPSQE